MPNLIHCLLFQNLRVSPVTPACLTSQCCSECRSTLSTKTHEVDVITTASSIESGDNKASQLDGAWKFLHEHRIADIQVDIAALRRKIDFRIVPLMFLCYTMQFLDKVILNYASVMGLATDLHLVGNDFSNIATFMFVALLCFEIPNTHFLQSFPAGKWLGVNVVLNYQTLLVSRVFLGILESTIYPSLLLISSQWHTKSEQAPRFSLWYLGLGLGQMIGGAVSYGFQHVSVNQTGIVNKKFKPREIVETLMDPQFYLLAIAVISLSVSSGVVTTYSSTLIKNLGCDSRHAALMNMPSGVVSIFFTLLVGIGIRFKSHRWAWILACIIPGIIGGALMSFLPTSNKAGCLIGNSLVNAVVAPLTVFLFLYYAWENKRRGAPKEEEREDAYPSPEIWADMTDRENRKFRYAY